MDYKTIKFSVFMFYGFHGSKKNEYNMAELDWPLIGPYFDGDGLVQPLTHHGKTKIVLSKRLNAVRKS
jgi:hypothetical protein